MKKSIAYCTLIVAAGLVAVFAAATPDILSDKNLFLQNFVNHEFLNVLGVILAITLASAAQLHLTFNQIEERYQQNGLTKTRQGVHSAASWLIGLFLCAIFLVTAKPLLSSEAWQQSLFNGAALFILLWYVLLLISLTKTVFSIKAEIHPPDP